MRDILSILHQNDSQTDPDDRLAALSDWSEEIAETLAKDCGLELTSQHLDILKRLRSYYSTQSTWNNPREILKVMEHTCIRVLGLENPRKELYFMFPHGPVREGCKLSGLPVPDNSSNPSVGSVM